MASNFELGVIIQFITGEHSGNVVVIFRQWDWRGRQQFWKLSNFSNLGVGFSEDVPSSRVASEVKIRRSLQFYCRVVSVKSLTTSNLWRSRMKVQVNPWPVEVAPPSFVLIAVCVNWIRTIKLDLRNRICDGLLVQISSFRGMPEPGGLFMTWDFYTSFQFERLIVFMRYDRSTFDEYLEPCGRWWLCHVLAWCWLFWLIAPQSGDSCGPFQLKCSNLVHTGRRLWDKCKKISSKFGDKLDIEKWGTILILMFQRISTGVLFYACLKFQCM